jgi:hypothetical protein
MFIPDPGSNNRNKRGGGNFFVLPFVAINIIKIVNNLFLNTEKFFFSQNTEVLSTQKFVKVSRYQKYGFGIRDSEKIYSGSGIQGKKDTGSRIRNTDSFCRYKKIRSVYYIL